MSFLGFSHTLPAVAVAAFLLVFVGRLSRVGKRFKDYPPGPPTWPLLGNLPSMPTAQRHLQFHKWAEQYGPIYSLTLGTQVWVVLSKGYAVKDLIDKKGPIYASRPDLYIPQTIFSGGKRPLFFPADNRMKLARKLNHKVLKIEVARTYVPYQDLENKALLLAILEDPKNFMDHIRRYTMSTVTQMTFGFRTTSIKDPRFRETFEFFDAFAEATTNPSGIMLDCYPVLRHLPEFVIPLKARARKLHERELKLFKGYYLDAKEELMKGTAKPCISVDLVKLQKEEQLSDDQTAYIGGSLLQAGAETTSGILLGFILAMLAYPETARAAQEELDRVCGDRLPDLNDVPDLPYIRAVIKETLRWLPGVPLGTPHAVTEDDEYKGYRIPKGATIVTNVWALHNDPSRFPRPRRFDPMRYIHDAQTSAEAVANGDVSKRDHFVFGAGRRVCQGMHIADRSMFFAVARMLWAFDFRRAIDPDTGREVVPDDRDLTEGIFAIPKPFPADIVPRDARRAERVREVWGEMLGLLDEELQWKTVPEGIIWRDYEPAEFEQVT